MPHRKFINSHKKTLCKNRGLDTARGTKYCSKAEKHDYQLYLALNDIEHTKTKAMSPQANSICELFPNEFHQETFCKRLYDDLEALQSVLDEWLVY